MALLSPDDDSLSMPEATLTVNHIRHTRGSYPYPNVALIETYFDKYQHANLTVGLLFYITWYSNEINVVCIAGAWDVPILSRNAHPWCRWGWCWHSNSLHSHKCILDKLRTHALPPIIPSAKTYPDGNYNAFIFPTYLYLLCVPYCFHLWVILAVRKKYFCYFLFMLCVGMHWSTHWCWFHSDWKSIFKVYTHSYM